MARKAKPMQTGIDCAWRSRVSSFYSGAEAAAIIARATGVKAEYYGWRTSEIAKEAEQSARPFDFADLNGNPEPEKWGPKYSKPVKRARFNDETNIPTNCASGQKRCFDAAKHRAKLRAEFAALANADRLAWALGKAKNERGETIAQAYARAMAEKAERLANPAAYAAKLAKVEAERLRLAKASRRVSRPRKAA
jgi:hypothetical protein